MKLTVKKQTVANLEKREMNTLQGGVRVDDEILLTITPTICPELCLTTEL